MNQLDIEKTLDKELLKAELAVEKRMRATLKVIIAQLTEMYAKYERNGVLTADEMNRYNRLQKEFKQLTETLTGDYQQSVAEIQAMQENHYLLKFLLTAYLFDRFVSLPRLPSAEVIAATFIFIITSLKLPRRSKGSENDAIIAIEKALKAGVEKRESKTLIAKRIKKVFPYQNSETDRAVDQLTDALVERLEATINEPDFKIPGRREVKEAVKYDGLTLSHYLTTKRNRMVSKLSDEINRALRKNETVNQMSKRIKDIYENEIKVMRRFMRNVSDRVRASALGIVENQIANISDVRGTWLSKRDSIVRLAHKRLDGQRTDRKGYFHYAGLKAMAPRMWGVPGMDNYCRCKKLTLVDFKVPIVAEGVEYNNQEYARQLEELTQKKKESLGMTYEKAFAEALKEIPPPRGDMPFVSYEEWLRIMGVKGSLEGIV